MRSRGRRGRTSWARTRKTTWSSPEQPWLDGFCVDKGVIRQFVAMPLGGGYTAEEQVTGKTEYGGLQILVHPMRRDVFERRFPERPKVVYARESEDHVCFSPRER